MSDVAMRGSSFSATAAAVGTVSNLEGCKCMSVQISGLASETIGISLSMDGATFSSAIKPVDVTTGAAAASAALGNGYYYLANVPLAFVKFTKSSTTDPAVVKYIAI